MKLDNLTIGTKLMGGFGLAVLLTITIGIISINKMDILAKQTVVMYKHPFAVTNAIRDIKANITAMHRSMKDVALASDSNEMAIYISKVDDIEAETNRFFAILSDRFLGGEEDVAELKKLFVDWKPIRGEVIMLMRNGKRNEAAKITKEKGVDHLKKLYNKIEQFDASASKKAEELFQTSLTTASTAKQTVVFFVIIISVIGFGVAYFVGRSVSLPITKAIDQIAEITGTFNLTKRVDIESGKEVTELTESFNAFLDELCKTLASFAEIATELGKSVSEISSGVQEQAAIASQQAASVTEITATVEEFSQTSSQIADNSDSVVDISNTALEHSQQGTVRLHDLNQKMEEISSENNTNLSEIVELGNKSNEIGKVMELIDAIANQTKLIAFNAAIEASSAGSAGKRFSIVAVEIRRLADNVMGSTKDIGHKVEEVQSSINRLVISSEKRTRTVGEGVLAANSTLDELVKIVDGAKDTADASTQISLATKQQKTASDQLLIALREIDTGIKQSSIAIRERTNITSSLSKRSVELQEMLSKFTLS